MDEQLVNNQPINSTWEKIQIARDPARPKALDFVQSLFPDFMELHGDRCFKDDAALLGGIATYQNQPVTILAQSKGKDLESNLKCNFAMMHPEGYRKVLRLAKQAEKFQRPIITFVDTAGAYPGIGAEERGQAQAIAECLKLFSTIQVPVICFVLSEGGSGGALALSVADRIYMFENAIYSILSPEGFASILWKDESRVQEAGKVMRCCAKDLYEDKIIDGIMAEPKEGLQTCLELGVMEIQLILNRELPLLMKKKQTNLLNERYEKFRKIGAF